MTDNWRPRAQALVKRLIADGDLHSPAWRDALLNVPRHEFVPRYYEQDTTTRPARWVLREPHGKASTARWLDLVYSATTLVTDVADYADRGIQIAVSSSTKPDLMIRMLEALDIQPGHRRRGRRPAPACSLRSDHRHLFTVVGSRSVDRSASPGWNHSR